MQTLFAVPEYLFMHKSKQAEFPHKNLTRVNKICPLEQTLHVCIWRYRAANPNPNYTDPKQQGFIFNPCRRFGIFFSFFFFPYPPCQQGGCEGNLGTCWCRTADETWIGERFKGLALPGLSLPDALLASEFVNTFWMQVYTLG